MKKSIAIFVISLLFISCEKEEQKQRVSWLRVSFSVDLNLDKELESLFAYKVYKKKDVLYAGEYLESPGVVVFNNGDPLGIGRSYAAYDIRCPYENRMDVLVTIDGAEATCQQCKSKYDLTFGNPKSGPSDKRLQDYCVSMSSSQLKRLIIQNCN